MSLCSRGSRTPPAPNKMGGVLDLHPLRSHTMDHPSATPPRPPQIKCDGESTVSALACLRAAAWSVAVDPKMPDRDSESNDLPPKPPTTHMHTGNLPCSTCFLRCRPCRPKQQPGEPLRKSGGPLIECILSRMDPLEIAAIYKEVGGCVHIVAAGADCVARPRKGAFGV